MDRWRETFEDDPIGAEALSDECQRAPTLCEPTAMLMCAT